MRISDYRYNRDRLRLDVAVRFIRHEARTRTIRQWTGLTDDRIRKLYHSYLQGGGRTTRHRGKSPRQAAYFLRTARMRDEASALASLCCLVGLFDGYCDDSCPRTRRMWAVRRRCVGPMRAIAPRCAIRRSLSNTPCYW